MFGLGNTAMPRKRNDNNQLVNTIDVIVCTLKVVVTIVTIVCFITLILLVYACGF